MVEGSLTMELSAAWAQASNGYRMEINTDSSHDDVNNVQIRGKLSKLQISCMHVCEKTQTELTFQLRWSSKHISHKTPAKSFTTGCISEMHSGQKVIYLPTSIYSAAITRQMIEAYMRLMGQNSTVAFSFYKYEYVMWPQHPSFIQNNTYLKKITMLFCYYILISMFTLSF